jgi:trimethylamine--corrinoid protein Co-methyltransferase
MTSAILRQVFTKGVSLDDEALAVDVIHQVGPGGEFMTHEHTLTHWRDLWRPKLYDRQRLERWEKQGSKDINARLRQRTIALLDEHEVEPLPTSVVAEIEKLLTRS